jgi:hypothetical protein
MFKGGVGLPTFLIAHFSSRGKEEKLQLCNFSTVFISKTSKYDDISPL